MSQAVRILDINPGSDGDGRKWPKHHYTRNDEYPKEAVAARWIKDLPGGAEPNVVYRLNKLPNGYAGFERQRADSKHTDRYIYGHPNGQFRSLNEFYPHFKYLMDFGGAVGCECKLCSGGNRKKKAVSGMVANSRNESESSTSPPLRFRFFPDQRESPPDSDAPPPNLISPFKARPRGRPPKNGRPKSESPKPEQRKLVDYEGTPDIYEALIARLKQADRAETLDVPIEEPTSLDWRTSNTMSKVVLKEWQKLPRYVPRVGEIVLFVRKLDEAERMSWDNAAQTFRRTPRNSKAQLEPLKWEAGIVTQMPQEVGSDEDLIDDSGKAQGVNYSGFRIEPLSEPGSDYKPYTKQHKHVPLHAIRPFVFWQECLNGVPEQDWHPSINHALTVSSSFCVIGRHRFRGTWPDATVFCRGVYAGSELILVGDTVRLMPRNRDQPDDTVTDVMIVTAIRLRFVNLDMEEEVGLSEENGLYQTCLHISGRVFTLDPTRSFDGVGRIPIESESAVLPAGLSGYGQWYHYSDPQKPTTRVEIPYTRVLGRCVEGTAAHAWFSAQSESTPKPNSKVLSENPVLIKDGQREISRGLKSLVEARQYSRQNDSRIKSQESKTWFWADTRVEQLDLHEVNGRFVGVKEERGPDKIKRWRTTLKALDGKEGALEEYHAVRKAQAAAKMKRESNMPSSSAYGMVAASRQVRTESPNGTEAERLEDEDAMDVDEEPDAEAEHSSSVEEEEPAATAGGVAQKNVESITLSDSDSEDDDELTTDQLAEELAKNIRPGDSGHRYRSEIGSS